MTRTEEAGILFSLLDVMHGEQQEPVIVKRRSTTSLRKYIIDQLFNDAYIIAFGVDCYRLRSKDHHPLRKFYNETFKAIKPILRHRRGHFLLNKNAVRSLHGNHYAKAKYRSLKKQKHELQSY